MDWVSDGPSSESGGWVDDGPARNLEVELESYKKQLADTKEKLASAKGSLIKLQEKELTSRSRYIKELIEERQKLANQLEAKEDELRNARTERQQPLQRLQELEQENKALTNRLDFASKFFEGESFAMAIVAGLIVPSFLLIVGVSIPSIRQQLPVLFSDSSSWWNIALVGLIFAVVTAILAFIILFILADETARMSTILVVLSLIIWVGSILLSMYILGLFSKSPDYVLKEGQCLSADAVSVYSMDIDQIKDSVVDCDSADAHLKVEKRISADELDKTDMSGTFVVSFEDFNQAYGLRHTDAIKVDQCFYRAREKNGTRWYMFYDSFPCDTTLTVGQLNEFYDRFTTSFNPQYGWESAEPQFEWDKVKFLATDVDEETCSKNLNAFSDSNNNCWSSLETIKK